MSSTLVAHNPKFQSRLVPYAQLKALPAPESMGPQHRPVPHHLLVDTILEESQRRGLVVSRQQYAIGKRGQALFGVIDYAPVNGLILGNPTEQGLSFGFRSANDQSLRITAVAGARVFVCDNLALSGDMVALSKKHTTFIDLKQEIRQGFDRFLGQAETLAAQLKALTEHELTDEQAKVLVFDAFARKFLPARLFDDVASNYFSATPEMTDCTPRTAWGLHNAFTRAIRDLKPAPSFRASMAIGKHFGLQQ